MSASTKKKPALSRPGDVDAATRASIERLIENVETITGRRGTPVAEIVVGPTSTVDQKVNACIAKINEIIRTLNE